jgi:molybdopterin-dependent oxidoreductase alpha subunit
MKRPGSGGGWPAILYSLRLARRVGWWKMWRAMRSANSCKTCAVGMGGQLGGMVNEAGYFPEVCKKSFQAMASDMQAAIPTEFFSKWNLDRLRALDSLQLEASGRLVTPLIARPGAQSYEPISWEEALDRVTSSMRAAGPLRSFFYASGRSSNEAGFLLQLLARRWGTNYVNNCSYYCHQASGVGLGQSIGSGAGTIRLEDLEHADLYILIGANPASNHPRLMRELMKLRRRGGRVIVINPVKELGLLRFRVPSDVRSLLFGSEIANDYLQPHIGGDIAVLQGIAKQILATNSHDTEFIERHTEGFAALRESLEQRSWAELEEQSGVTRAEMTRVAAAYARAKNVVIGWCMGITHHLHGTDNVRMIANLALLRGMAGREGAGLMPIRGHSNVQGLGTVGVSPALKQALLERWEARLGEPPPASPGYDTMACMDAAERGEMDFAFCLGGNLYGSNPDAPRASRVLGKLQTLVYLSTTLNTGHAWGLAKETMILPVLPRDEESQATTQESMFSYVRLSEGGPARHVGPRSEVSLLAALGQQLLPSDSAIDWKRLESHAAIRALIAELVPEYERLASLDGQGKEFHVPGRAIRNYQFPTATGRAQFSAIQVPPLARDTQRLRLMTVRSEGQFNSVVYDSYDLYRGQERRDVILMNPADLQRLGLQPDQRVNVKSTVGEVQYLLARPFDVRAGNAVMYYPEANPLIPTAVDPRSKTPAFKSIEIQVQAVQTTG